jgi:hypothetical protein
MKCKICEEQGLKSKLYSGYGAVTCMGVGDYYDEDGKHHYHDPNDTTIDYSCSNGHEYRVVYKNKCHSCDYGKEE